MTDNSTEERQNVVDDAGIVHQVRSRFGIEFDTRAGWWPISGNNGINVASVRKLVTPELLPGLEMTLRYSAERYALATLHQYSAALKHFQNTIFPRRRIERWDLEDLRAWRAQLMKNFGHEDYLRQVRSLLLNWAKGAWHGVPKNVVDGLREMRLKGAETGRAVRVLDLKKGPLTPEEFHELQHCLYDKAEEGRLSWDEFSLGYLFILIARRPIQVAHLKCMDLILQHQSPDHEDPEGKVLHMLAIPRSKQKGHGFRQTRRAVDLNEANFAVYCTQRDNVQDRFRSLLKTHGWILQEADLKKLLEELPLYPNWSAVQKCIQATAEISTAGEHGRALDALRCDAVSGAWHRNEKILSQAVTHIYDSLGVRARDGSRLQVTPQRLRYTKGTSLAREGFPAHIIAWLLDHSTSRNVNIYVENLPEQAAQINAAMSKSPTMQRIASMFRGTLVDAESEAVGGDNPARSRLHYKGKGAATCGHLKQCGLDGGIPRCCYTCFHFQPWLDGPHEDLLNELLQERDKDVAVLGPDSPVAKRRDKLIAAVRYVINLCQMRREELEGSA